MPQDRMDPVQNGGSQQGTFYQTPDISDTLAKTARVVNKVRVVHGANEGYFDLEGKSVGSVRKSLREVFRIPGDADAFIGDKSVSDEVVLEGGQVLEFSKDHGTKGCSKSLSHKGLR